MRSLAERPELVGFFSYSRGDDQDSNGALSELREAIQRELRAQLGRSRRELRLWQDQEAIPFGTLWESQIKKAIGESVFFIPIITPHAVRSENCKIEFNLFIQREKELHRDDLVFPILYIAVPDLEEERIWRRDPILKPIGERQYRDWRQYRFRDLKEPLVREEVALFCKEIVNALCTPMPEAPGESLIEAQQAEARRKAANRELQGKIWNEGMTYTERSTRVKLAIHDSIGGARNDSYLEAGTKLPANFLNYLLYYIIADGYCHRELDARVELGGPLGVSIGKEVSNLEAAAHIVEYCRRNGRVPELVELIASHHGGKIDIAESQLEAFYVAEKKARIAIGAIPVQEDLIRRIMIPWIKYNNLEFVPASAGRADKLFELTAMEVFDHCVAYIVSLGLAEIEATAGWGKDLSVAYKCALFRGLPIYLLVPERWRGSYAEVPEAFKEVMMLHEQIYGGDQRYWRVYERKDVGGDDNEDERERLLDWGFTLQGILRELELPQLAQRRLRAVENDDRHGCIFMSYSHTDQEWLVRLQQMLTPLVGMNGLRIWDDKRIIPGANWRQEIEQALASARAAVLLVSQDFLLSEFINRYELPPLLERARERGVKLLWVAVRPSTYEASKLAQYQAVNNPLIPLSTLEPSAQEQALVDIARKIKEVVE